jgi:uncharacterized protein with HEPN domain
MAKTDLLYLGHMLDAARETQQIIAGMSRVKFDQDRTARLALVHLIQTIGEAARRVSHGQQALVPVPWQQIRGMRNRIVHDYTNINNDILWDTITLHIPPLIAELDQAVANFNKTQNP